MKKLSVLLLALSMAFIGLEAGASDDKTIKMSTTTSTQASGLLDILLPAFEKDTGIKVLAIAKGTGAAIRDGEDGNVDVIFVHAKQREDDFIAKGFGTKRYGVMHNDFIILGPASDPAGIKGCSSAADALKKIAAKGAIFVSRGDDSGTHTKEQALWKESGLPMKEESKTIVKKGKERKVSFMAPEGDWYNSIGQGMGKALTFADEKQGYVLSDRGTFIKYKFGRDVPIELNILCEGDTKLANPYGVIPVNPKTHPHAKFDMADQFAQWLVSERGQKLIGDYRLLDKQLFYPDAVK
jgi:tungstate transport system substrate-binding protein